MCDSGPPFPCICTLRTCTCVHPAPGSAEFTIVFQVDQEQTEIYGKKLLQRNHCSVCGGVGVCTHAHMQTHKQIASLWRTCRSKRIYPVALFFLNFFFLRLGLSLNPEPDISARTDVQPVSTPIPLTHQTPILPRLWVTHMSDRAQLSKWALRIWI